LCSLDLKLNYVGIVPTWPSLFDRFKNNFENWKKHIKKKLQKNELKRKNVDGNKGVLNWKTNPDYMNNKAPLKFPNLLIKWDNKLTWIIL